MAKSKTYNQLNDFVTYSYHFELHASPLWDDIAKLESQEAIDSPTLPTNPTGLKQTMLINTRYDAHQIIDDVHFGYIGPSANNKGFFTPDGDLTLKIYEPNRVYFIQKIQNLMNIHNVTNPNNLHWALKVFFVGRNENNQVAMIPGYKSGITIPMAFVEMESTFGEKGSEYTMHFVSLGSFAVSDNPRAESFVMLAGYFNQNVTLSAPTVRTALQKLQDTLNDLYTKTFQNEVRDPGMRKIRYEINVAKDFPDGALDLNTTTSFVPGSAATMTLTCEETIIAWIYRVIRSSKSINALVGDSLNTIRTQGHPGVNFVSVYPTYRASAAEIVLIYNVYMYTGGVDEQRVYEFNFMYGDVSTPALARKNANVDVLGLNMHMGSAQAWFSDTTTTSTAAQAAPNKPPTGQAQNAKENKAQVTPIYKNNDAKFYIPGSKPNDPLYLPATPRFEKSGMISVDEKAAQSMKLMYNSIIQMHSAFDPMFTMTIRGSLPLLGSCIIKPQTPSTATTPSPGLAQEIPFGVTKPAWVKVNVKNIVSENDKDEITTAPFFYTGLYNLISIKNHFVGGKFTQTLEVLKMNDPAQNANPTVQTQIQQGPSA